ncbi:MAG: hypothetical protein IJ501_00680 [Bacilli bacterium]|nr:hypothetical protein [Bacilli bacterium]
MQEYTKVPDIITGKDLDYLSDMFEWNILSLKKTNDSIPKVNDEKIKDTLKKACGMFDTNLKVILSLLGGNNE